jgi:hypothetical protein
MPGMPDDGAVAVELCDFENDDTADSIFVRSGGSDISDMASAADHHLLPPHNPYVRNTARNNHVISTFNQHANITESTSDHKPLSAHHWQLASGS